MSSGLNDIYMKPHHPYVFMSFLCLKQVVKCSETQIQTQICFLLIYGLKFNLPLQNDLIKVCFKQHLNKK